MTMFQEAMLVDVEAPTALAEVDVWMHVCMDVWMHGLVSSLTLVPTGKETFPFSVFGQIVTSNRDITSAWVQNMTVCV